MYDAFDCSVDPANDIDASPATITCATDGSCTATECCTALSLPGKVSSSASACVRLIAFVGATAIVLF
eukprot:COSAG02_NODE_3892_length_6074_cov_5.045690_9_plen_68_part_00